MSGETLRIRKQMTQGNLLFGEYTLLHVLAQGPVGVVCEAEHNSLKRMCALKMVHPTYAEKQGFSFSLIDAFLREARIMASIDHPHVVPVYHAGTVGQCPFIAMRLIRGGTLQSRIDKSGSVTPDWALRLLRDAADGLRAVHGAGFRHGAVLPEHLLLEADGSPRLAGFDLAMALDAARPKQEIVQALAAPEDAGGGVLGVRSDLYGLGVTISLALGQTATALRAGIKAEQHAIAMLSANAAAARLATAHRTQPDARAPHPGGSRRPLRICGGGDRGLQASRGRLRTVARPRPRPSAQGPVHRMAE